MPRIFRKLLAAVFLGTFLVVAGVIWGSLAQQQTFDMSTMLTVLFTLSDFWVGIWLVVVVCSWIGFILAPDGHKKIN